MVANGKVNCVMSPKRTAHVRVATALLNGPWYFFAMIGRQTLMYNIVEGLEYIIVLCTGRLYCM